MSDSNNTSNNRFRIAGGQGTAKKPYLVDESNNTTGSTDMEATTNSAYQRYLQHQKQSQTTRELRKSRLSSSDAAVQTYLQKKKQQAASFRNPEEASSASRPTRRSLLSSHLEKGEGKGSTNRTSIARDRSIRSTATAPATMDSAPATSSVTRSSRKDTERTVRSSLNQRTTTTATTTAQPVPAAPPGYYQQTRHRELPHRRRSSHHHPVVQDSQSRDQQVRRSTVPAASATATTTSSSNGGASSVSGRSFSKKTDSLTAPQRRSVVDAKKQQPQQPQDEPKKASVVTNSGWSTMRKHSHSGRMNVTTPALQEHERYVKETNQQSNNQPSGSGSQKVDEYLKQRQAQLQKSNQTIRLGRTKEQIIESISSADSTDSILEAEEPSVVTSSSSDEEEEDDTRLDEDVVSLADDPMEGDYSVNVCVVSAVDFPNSVIPNLPFSPGVKVGLVPASKQSRVPSQGLDQSTRSSRIQCTSTKILSKRDNGSVEFHEEVRFDNVSNPSNFSIGLELSSKGSMPPANYRESPKHSNHLTPFSVSSIGKISRPTDPGGISGLFRSKVRKGDSAEMEQANAAAAVAKLLVEGNEATNDRSVSPVKLPPKEQQQSEWNVQLRSRTKRLRRTEELRLGSLVVPLGTLPLEKAESNKIARIEQWFELKSSHASPTSLCGTSPTQSTATRNPSILLEISVAKAAVLNESEDDMDDVDPGGEVRLSYSKRASLKIRRQLKQDFEPEVEKVQEPMLEPGIIDYVCVVGARDIGDQKADDGSRGWVNSTPECCVLEQFPPNDEFHIKNGRMVALPGKVEWFCFPEGCRLWRGLTPPNPDELNLRRFSASSPPMVSSTVACFDACLGCTASFSWFVISSSSDEYGSENKKTYGAVIRFYVPAPAGIDPTQDDFAQTTGQGTPKLDRKGETKRLWVPLGICMTSSMPIVGTMEVILLRFCEALSSAGDPNAKASNPSQIVRSLASLVLHHQKPVPGVVNCSFSFLEGERLQIALPPRNSLPALPHGNSITSVCRLVGADGLNYLLAAFLTECKILLHSDDIANLCLVAEVVTSLLYPFQWSLPYIPVLPADMMEFLEAPMSFLLGVPSCNMDYVDPALLEDIVVVDLDRDFAGNEYFERRRTGTKSKSPIPLPAASASNISKAVYKLLRAEDEVEDSFDATGFTVARTFPRIEPESLAEREFRISVGLEVCGLIRGFDECLVFSSAQPVFNVDKFLQMAPAVFEEQRLSASNQTPGQQHGPRQVISARSRRFLSILVCCQHFHQFLEALESESLAFFHLIMRSVNAKFQRKEASLASRLMSLDTNKTIGDLCSTLQSVEDRIPTYKVKNYEAEWKETKDMENRAVFPVEILKQIVVESRLDLDNKDGGNGGVKSISLDFLVELEKNPWRYHNILQVGPNEDSPCLDDGPVMENVSVREALGDRRYRAWKCSSGFYESDEASMFSEDSKGATFALDVKALLQSVGKDDEGAKNTEEQSLRDCLVRCLESSNAPLETISETSSEGSQTIIERAEDALQDPAAQKFLLSILRTRIRQNSSGIRSSRRLQHSGGSKVETSTFDTFVRLAFSMLDACSERLDYESAYALLKLTAGLYTSAREGENEVAVVYLTERIALHPIYANLEVWDHVKILHSRENTSLDHGKEERDEHEYESIVATLYEMNGYGIPAEELARFASRTCGQHGWFNAEKGQALLMLAKRVGARREQGLSAATPSKVSDIELISPSPRKQRKTTRLPSSSSYCTPATKKRVKEDQQLSRWIDTGWCHPAAQPSKKAGVFDGRRLSPQNLMTKFDGNTSEGAKYMKRSPVTSMAYLGSSVVVTGGLDGGVFMARRVKTSHESERDGRFNIRGVHLDWGSSGSRYTVGTASTSLDGEYGVGAVTCLASTRNTLSASQSVSRNMDVVSALEEEEILEAMEGCRVVAGTTCGDLRVWSVKDVFAAVFFATRGGDFSSPTVEKKPSSTPSSAYVSRRRSSTDFAAGSSMTRLKFSLRGRALSGHRGGVSCVDVHSNVYRPDSIVTGGADGLIKLWSLRTPGTSGGRRTSLETPQDSLSTPRAKAARSGDALSILSGHGGRVLCVKTAWHGERLLSGGADRTVRLWDLGGSGGKCLNTLTGHFGWVTKVQYWGTNTLISTSSDRTIALWDARVGNSPLYILRHHGAPVSDILVRPRNDPVMISTAIDGSVAAWDFRQMTNGTVVGSSSDSGNIHNSAVNRSPYRYLYRHAFIQGRTFPGPMQLGRGVSVGRKTATFVGSDSVVREWDYVTGEILSEDHTGHCDTISSFMTLNDDNVLNSQLESTGPGNADCTISASWDGTVRMRMLRR